MPPPVASTTVPPPPPPPPPETISSAAPPPETVTAPAETVTASQPPPETVTAPPTTITATPSPPPPVSIAPISIQPISVQPISVQPISISSAAGPPPTPTVVTSVQVITSTSLIPAPLGTAPSSSPDLIPVAVTQTSLVLMTTIIHTTATDMTMSPLSTAISPTSAAGQGAVSNSGTNTGSQTAATPVRTVAIATGASAAFFIAIAAVFLFCRRSFRRSRESALKRRRTGRFSMSSWDSVVPMGMSEVPVDDTPGPMSSRSAIQEHAARLSIQRPGRVKSVEVGRGRSRSSRNSGSLSRTGGQEIAHSSFDDPGATHEFGPTSTGTARTYRWAMLQQATNERTNNYPEKDAFSDWNLRITKELC